MMDTVCAIAPICLYEVISFSPLHDLFLSLYISISLNSPSGYDPKRSLKGFVWSAFLYTPVAHVWYNRFLEKSIPKTDFPAVCSKVALDQLLFAPVVNVVGSLGYVLT